MKRIGMALTAALALVVFGTATALAQPAKLHPEINIDDEKALKAFRLSGDVQEEVEILRRLLDKSFESVYGFHPTDPLASPARFFPMIGVAQLSSDGSRLTVAHGEISKICAVSCCTPPIWFNCRYSL